MQENKVNVQIDFKNPDSFAVELTKLYLEKNTDNGYRSPKEFVGIFIIAYSRILTELESIRQNEQLSESLVKEAMKIDFSKFEQSIED